MDPTPRDLAPRGPDVDAPELRRGVHCARRQAGTGRTLTAVANVTVNLLGGFAASVDGVAVAKTSWRLKKARELVKLLALAPGHRLHREQAMDALWGDRGPAAASNNLHQAVYVARRALDPGAIEVRDEILQLAAVVDIDRLQTAAAGPGPSGAGGG